MLDAAVGQLNRQLQSSPPKRSNLSARLRESGTAGGASCDQIRCDRHVII